MRKWHDETIRQLAQHSLSDEELRVEITRCTKALNFDFWMFGIRLPIPISHPLTQIRSNFPDIGQSRYLTQDYLENDPVLRHCYVSSVPIIWSADAPLSEQPRLEDGRTQAMRYGWSMSMRHHAGAVTWLTLARNCSPIGMEELALTEYSMIWLAHLVHARMGATMLPTMLSGGLPRLSPREREVMRWTAEGKTAAEIGQILDIAESTCIFHIGNAIRKLGAVNKTHAAARAALLGLIT